MTSFAPLPVPKEFQVRGANYLCYETKVNDFCFTLLVTSENGMSVGRCQVDHDLETIIVNSGHVDVKIDYEQYSSNKPSIVEFIVEWKVKKNN